MSTRCRSRVQPTPTAWDTSAARRRLARTFSIGAGASSETTSGSGNARRDSDRIAAVCRSTASAMAGSIRDGDAIEAGAGAGKARPLVPVGDLLDGLRRTFGRARSGPRCAWAGLLSLSDSGNSIMVARRNAAGSDGHFGEGCSSALCLSDKNPKVDACDECHMR